MENWFIFKFFFSFIRWFKRIRNPVKRIVQIQRVGNNSIGIQSRGNTHINLSVNSGSGDREN